MCRNIFWVNMHKYRFETKLTFHGLMMFQLQVFRSSQESWPSEIVMIINYDQVSNYLNKMVNFSKYHKDFV